MTSAVSVHRPIARTNPADLLFSTYPQGTGPARILLYSGGFGALLKRSVKRTGSYDVAWNAFYRSTGGKKSNVEDYLRISMHT
jgi:hypothetical protein